jgi:hypothetical protein
MKKLNPLLSTVLLGLILCLIILFKDQITFSDPLIISFGFGFIFSLMISLRKFLKNE